MQGDLKSDLLGTAALSLALVVFSLFLQPSPPPPGMLSVANWNIQLLNAVLADRFYTQALISLQSGDPAQGKQWLVSAIAVDPQAFSLRYKQFIDQRTQWLAQ